MVCVSESDVGKGDTGLDAGRRGRIVCPSEVAEAVLGHSHKGIEISTISLATINNVRSGCKNRRIILI